MSNLVPFQFDDKEVRTVVEGDEVWFIAQDVARALGYDQTNSMNKLIDSEDKKKTTLQNGGNYQNQSLINESGLYQAIFNSTLPAAKRFKKWVTSEVLPSIRKTGKYSVPQTTGDMLVQMATAYAEQEKNLLALEARQKEMEARHEDRFKRVEAKQTAFEEGHSYFTVLGYCAYKGITIDLTAAKALMSETKKTFGARATAIWLNGEQVWGRGDEC